MTASLGCPCEKTTFPLGYDATRRAAPADSKKALASKAGRRSRDRTRRAFGLGIVNRTNYPMQRTDAPRVFRSILPPETFTRQFGEGVAWRSCPRRDRARCLPPDQRDKLTYRARLHDGLYALERAQEMGARWAWTAARAQLRAARACIGPTFVQRPSFSERPCRPSSVVSVSVCWSVVADAYPLPSCPHDLPSRAPLQRAVGSGLHGNRLSDRIHLRRFTNTPHRRNAPHERCQRGDTSGMSLPCSTSSLALAIGDRGRVDGDIDHGLAHLRTHRKSRQRTRLPLSRDHRRSVTGGAFRGVRVRHTGTRPFLCLAPEPLSALTLRLHVEIGAGCSGMHTGSARMCQQPCLSVPVYASEQTQRGHRGHADNSSRPGASADLDEGARAEIAEAASCPWIRTI